VFNWNNLHRFRKKYLPPVSASIQPPHFCGFFDSEYKGRNSFQNISEYLPRGTVSHTTQLEFSEHSLWKSHISSHILQKFNVVYIAMPLSLAVNCLSYVTLRRKWRYIVNELLGAIWYGPNVTNIYYILFAQIAPQIFCWEHMHFFLLHIHVYFAELIELPTFKSAILFLYKNMSSTLVEGQETRVLFKYMQAHKRKSDKINTSLFKLLSLRLTL
jgi:hypothetical protein